MKALTAAALLAGAWVFTSSILLLLQRGLRVLSAPRTRWSAAGGLLILILSIWSCEREILVPRGAGFGAAEQLLTGQGLGRGFQRAAGSAFR